jgi:cytochrome c-type biogenesis protein CcmE
VRTGDTNAFVVTDGQTEVSAKFVGILPDLFREGQGIVAEGSLAADGSFAASNVLAKHDENYMPKEVVDSLKARGEWQRDQAAGGS